MPAEINDTGDAAMQTFYAPADAFDDKAVTLTGDEYRHATRAVRVRVGEAIGVTDGLGRRVEARITSISPRTVTAEIVRDVSGIGEPVCEITVALSVIKPALFEMAVEKCTELGVRRFVPVIAERCETAVQRLKRERLKRIALAAAKQSERSWVPVIDEAVSIEALIDESRDKIIVAVPRVDTELVDIPLGDGVLPRGLIILAGPEGGFDDRELDMLMHSDMVKPVRLGGTILRSETAVIAGAGIIAMKCLG